MRFTVLDESAPLTEHSVRLGTMFSAADNGEIMIRLLCVCKNGDAMGPFIW